MSEQERGYRILLTMFEIAKTMTRRTDRECFNQVVRFLADCARVHPMPEEDHRVADQLIPMAKPLLEAWYEEPYDYLGQLFSEKECAIKGMGQVITPPWIVSYINDSVLGVTKEEPVRGTDEEEGSEEERWKLVLDPCTGTGRFLLDMAWRHRDKKLALFGVELDLDLYRACLVNMRLYAFGRPYFILRADALIVDLMPSSPNWGFANRWNPPDWQTQMITSTGETYAQWKAEHGFEEPPEREVAGREARPRVQVLVEDLPLFRELGEEQEDG